jgi:endonuclease/exonuclease/phosphatase family metal-dependent hydrolase
MPLAVVTWNLYHGRSVPPARRDLLPDFAAALAGWDWDVALLQEVPPWWPPELARVAGAQERRVLTSRNQLLPVRRALATRWPDLMRSGGGGCNAILVRGARILEHRRLRLTVLPERRWLHAVRLDSGVWVGNLHATAHHPSRAAEEGLRAGAVMLGYAGGAPAVLGGDFNQRRPELRALELPGWRHAAGHDVDHIFVVGLEPVGVGRALATGLLSDHRPVAVRLACGV